ncbi:MAG: methyltransferase domain-containing protein [Verrucomicrobiota bacterium]
MSDARLRLYHYPSDARCAALHLMLRQSELRFDLVPLNYCEPSPVVQLTKGNYYNVPVLEDLLMAQVIYELSPGQQNCARHVDTLAQMELFPEAGKGRQEVLTVYLETQCRPLAARINDAYYDRWLKTDLERGLLRRARENAQGRGCLEAWLRDVNELMEEFNDRLRPLNHLLGEQSFLLGPKVTYADYALVGLLREFLHSGGTHLSTEFVHLGNWLDKMEGGQFPRGKVAGGDGGGDTAEGADLAGEMDNHALNDPSDVEALVKSLKISAGRQALVVGCATGRTAVAVAKLGSAVTAIASDAAQVERTKAVAQEAGIALQVHRQAPEELPPEDGRFDLVVTRMASRHFEDGQRFLSEANRVLRMYGYVVVVDLAGLDDHPEVTRWLNEMETLRDPRHRRLIRPNEWRRWCAPLGLQMVTDQPQVLPVPDLDAYLDLAGTPPENRTTLAERFARAPVAVRELLKISMEGGKTSFLLPKITLVMGKI